MTLVGCAGGATASSSDPPSPAPDASSTPAADAAAEPQSIASDASGWLAGNRITLRGATYDPADGVITVETVVDNGASTESLDPGFADSILLDVGDGAPLTASSISSVAVPLTSTNVDLEFRASPDAELSLESAVLTLGGPGEATWSVPLEPGADGEGIEPVSFPVSGVADAGGLLFTATSGEVLPWACDEVDDYGPGGSGRIWYVPGAAGEAAVVIWGDILETRSIVGGDTALAASLRGPDGASSPQIGTVNTVFDVNQGIEDYPLCFTVERPVGGAYTLTWNSYRQASAQLTIDVPAD